MGIFCFSFWIHESHYVKDEAWYPAYCYAKLRMLGFAKNNVERQAVGRFSQASNSIKHLHKQLQHRGSYQPKTNNKFGPVSVYGKTQKQKINESEASALCLLFGANIQYLVE